MRCWKSLKNHQNEERVYFRMPMFILPGVVWEISRKSNNETAANSTMVAFLEVDEMTIKFTYRPTYLGCILSLGQIHV